MAKKKTAPSADIKTKKVLVNVILDRSGSMSGIRSSTIAGYNEFLASLRADKESEYNISLFQFDANYTDPHLTISYIDTPLSKIVDLTEEGYVPRGMTPLYDAIGESVRRIEQKGRGVTVMIITDGHENQSKEFTKYSVKAMITEKEKDGWKFNFMGANIDSFAVGGALGISPGATANYNAQHVNSTFAAAATSNMRYAANARTKGVRGASVMMCFDAGERSAMMGQDQAQPMQQVPPMTQTTPSTGLFVNFPPTFPTTGGTSAAQPTFPVTATVADGGTAKPKRAWKDEVPVSK